MVTHFQIKLFDLKVKFKTFQSFPSQTDMLKLKLFEFKDPSENQLSPIQVLISILTPSFFYSS